MALAKKKTAVKKVPKKTAASTHPINKPAKTGKIVSAAAAERSPDTTYTTEVANSTSPPAKKAAKKAVTPVAAKIKNASVGGADSKKSKAVTLSGRSSVPFADSKQSKKIVNATQTGVVSKPIAFAAVKKSAAKKTANASVPKAPAGGKKLAAAPKKDDGLTPVQRAQRSLTGTVGSAEIEKTPAFSPPDTAVNANLAAAAQRLASS